MTERESIRRALEHLHASDGTLEEVLNVIDTQTTVKHLKRTGRNTLRTVLIAAAVAALGIVTAWAVGIGRIVFTEKDILVIQDGEDEPAEFVEVGFDTTTDGPVHMGVWTLDVPDGFAETEGGYYRDSDAAIYWKDANGKRVLFEYQAADLAYGQMQIIREGILEDQDVTVNGAPGHRYVLNDGQSMLFWVDEEKGVGFRLVCEADSIDLLALAETAHQTDDKPEMNTDTLDAIAEFGDWAPTVLPDGYREYISNGMPSKYGGDGDYGYVYRTYVNDAGYTIELDYEVTYDWATYDTYVGYYRDLPEDYTVTDTNVQGRPAGLVENADGTPYMLSWISDDGILAFKMYAEALTADELVTLAESVTLRQ